MKKIISFSLAVVMIFTSFPFFSSFASPAVSASGYVVKYIAYIFSLLGFKLYDDSLKKSFLADFISIVSSEQYSDISDYLDGYDSFDNVEVRKKDIDMVYDIYRSIYGTSSALLDTIVGNDYSINFDVLKDLSLTNGLVGQFYKNRFYYRDYTDDLNWQSRLENFVFGSDDKKIIMLPYSDSIVSTLFAEINSENLKKLNLSFSYEFIYNTYSTVVGKEVYTKYDVRKFNRRLVDGVLTDSVLDYSEKFKGAPFSGANYYVYLQATTLDEAPCLFVRYYEENTKYSTGIKNMYIPYELYKWKFVSYSEVMHDVEVLLDNSYIVDRIKNLFVAGKKLFADLTTAIAVLSGPITDTSDNYDRVNERLKAPEQELAGGLITGALTGLLVLSRIKAGTSLKYAVNGAVVDTTFDNALGGLGSGAQEGAQEGAEGNTSSLTALAAGVLALEKLLNKANSIARSQTLALEAIRNSNFNNHNHDFKSPNNLNFLDKFPFCLAKDVHLLLNVFSSDSKKPIFEINILGNVIVLDFTKFDLLANIVRISVTITFIFGLIVLTRKVVQ